MTKKILVSKQLNAKPMVIDTTGAPIINRGPIQGLREVGATKVLSLADATPIDVTTTESTTSCWLMNNETTYALQVDDTVLPFIGTPSVLANAIYNDEYFSARLRMAQCGLFNGTDITDEAGGWAFVGLDASKQKHVEIMLRDTATMEEVGIRINFSESDNFRAILDAVNFNQRVASFFYRNKLRLFQHIPFVVPATIGELVPLNISYQGDAEILIRVNVLDGGTIEDVAPIIYAKAQLGVNASTHYIKIKDNARTLPKPSIWGGKEIKFTEPVMVKGYVTGVIGYSHNYTSKVSHVVFNGFATEPTEIFEFLRNQSYSNLGKLNISPDGKLIQSFNRGYDYLYSLDCVADEVTGAVLAEPADDSFKKDGNIFNIRLR